MAGGVTDTLAGLFQAVQSQVGLGSYSTAGKIVEIVRQRLLSSTEVSDLCRKKQWADLEKDMRLIINFDKDNLYALLAQYLPIVTHYATFTNMEERDKVAFREGVASRIVIRLLKELKSEHGSSSETANLFGPRKTVHATITMVPLQVDAIKKAIREAASIAGIHNDYMDPIESDEAAPSNPPAKSVPVAPSVSEPDTTSAASSPSTASLREQPDLTAAETDT